MILTEKEVSDLGFIATVPALPYVLRNYEKEMPSGSIIVLTRPGVEKARRVVIECIGCKVMAGYWVESKQDLLNTLSGNGRKINISTATDAPN